MDSGKPHPLEVIARTRAPAVLLLLLALALALSPARAAAAEPSLLVTSQLDHAVKEYDGTTGAFVRNAATGIGDPLDAIIGSDGNLLVTDGQHDVIMRFDWMTGSFLDVFASAVSPQGMTISDDKVYVCQSNSPQIIRSFDAITGADAGSFIPTVGGGNPSPRDVKVANGRLYAAYWNLGTVEMFDLTTRQSLGLLFPPGSGGLSTPFSMAFGPDRNLYVSYGTFVNRYHPTSGAFLGQFVDTGDRTGQRYAVGMAWGPDGNLYVSTQNTAGVQRYNGTTGVFMDDFVPPGSGGLTAPFHMSFTPFGSSSVEIAFEFTPGTLNLGSQGLWVTGFLEPAPPFTASDIDISSIRLNGTVSVEPGAPTALGDHNENGITDLMVKFDRAAVELTVSEGDHVPITVTGTVGGRSFIGTDEIRVIHAVVTAPVAASHLTAGSVTQVRWQTPSGATALSAALRYSIDGGNTWNPIATGQPNTGSYDWMVPNVQTDQAQVAVEMGEPADESGYMLSEEFSIDAAVGVGDQGQVQFGLGVAPNPAQRELRVSFSLRDSKPATLALFDLSGRQVRSLRVEALGVGQHTMTLGGLSSLPPGLYVIRLTQNGRTLTTRAAVVR